MKKHSIIAFSLFLLFYMLPMGVNAAEDDYICVSGNLYDVVSKGEKVNAYQIESTHIKKGTMLPDEYFAMKEYLKEHEIDFGAQLPDAGYSDLLLFMQLYGNVYREYGVNVDESQYEFQVVSLNRRCNRQANSSGGYTWTSCPTTDQAGTSKSPYTTVQIKKAILHDGVVFDEARGQYYLEFEDNFDSNLIIRVVRNGKKNSEEYDLMSAQRLGIVQASELIELGSSGTKIYSNIGAGYDLEFYLKSSVSPCGGAYLGRTNIVVPDYADVSNPWKNSAICTNFRTSSDYSHIPEQPVNYKSILVPECYQDTIDYTERSQITEASIQAKIDKVMDMFVISNDADIDNLTCGYIRDETNNVSRQTKTFVYGTNEESSGALVTHYWEAICTETVEIRYDPPKATNAGGGFTYNTTVTVTRQCTPHAIGLVEKPSQCTYDVECWYGPANHTGESGAGPNEEFDQCVKTCDGGVYSQDCINQCYQKVYEGADIEIAPMSYGNNFLDVVKAKQMALSDCSTQTPTSPNYCYLQQGWKTTNGKTPSGRTIFQLAASSNQQANCNGSTSCTTFHGREFTYLNGCNSSTNPTLCYEVYTSRIRPECSDNPDEDYNKLKEAADQEYMELLAKLREYETGEEVEISITDSYKTDNKGNPLVTTNSTIDNMVKITGGVQKYSDTGLTYKETPNVSNEVYSNNGDTKSVPTVEVKKEYQIDLPQAVIDQLTGQEKYVNTSYRIPNHELDGGNKYYTDLNSDTINDYRLWGNADFYPEYNIHVVFQNVGTKQTSGNSTYTWDSINLKCFYGLINKNYVDCEGKDCDDELTCEEGDVCTGGIQYMFREVDLRDLFPDRDPRWNWTYAATVDEYGYYSNPEEVIQDVEALGNDAYSEGHLEYEIVLTRQNIRAIRSQNKKLGNYLNYDMTCTLYNGKKVCDSNLLNNTHYAKSFIKYRPLGADK